MLKIPFRILIFRFFASENFGKFTKIVRFKKEKLDNKKSPFGEILFCRNSEIVIIFDESTFECGQTSNRIVMPIGRR